MLLNQVKAIITGGASGLGLAVAKHFRGRGAAIALFDVNRAGAEVANGLDAGFFSVDVCNEAAVNDAVTQASERLNGVNVLVNCAGVLGAGRVLGKEGPMALDQFSRTVMINLVGSFNVAKAVAARMQANPPGDDGERGVIIHTASVAAYEGQIGQAAYAASKGGVVGMTLPMAREFARIGVRVMTVAPGVFHTPMVEGMPPAVYESLCAQVPFPSRLGQGEEFASTCAFIVENRYLNGEVIRVDGAIRLQPK
jgi:NAD(P)-dependent dehydrogenase (short-subunit alcohol dehydrogenase family)